MSEAIDAAAALLIAAHRNGRPIERLPVELRPVSDEQAYAIQAAIAEALGPVTGWKTGISAPGATPTCAPLFAPLIENSGASLPAGRFHGLALEIEFAFRLTETLPPRESPYSYDEVAAAIEFVPLIEVVCSRFRDPGALSAPEKLADTSNNGLVILGQPRADWHGLDFDRQTVTLSIDGEIVQSAVGTHPAGDPVSLVVWQANFVADRYGGLRAGDIVTTGSLQGATPARAGSRAIGDWGAWGRVEIRLT